jgi:hypothetical protein
MAFIKSDWLFLPNTSLDSKSSKLAKGKSGGARVITYLVTGDKEVYLVFIYDKSQLENISKEQIFEMLRKANLI